VLSELVEAGITNEQIKAFEKSVSEAGSLLDKLNLDNLSIKHPITKARPETLTVEYLRALWEEVVGRVIIARLSADRTLRDLLLGFIDAISTRNTLLGALAARAALEGAASYDGISRKIMGKKELIEAELLPFLRRNSHPTKSLYVPSLIDDLIRFQHGTRFWSTGDCPMTVEECHAWLKNSIYESKDDEKEQSIAGQLLDALRLNQTNVLTNLKNIAGRTLNMYTLGIYHMLSEFCHPNADNRNLGVHTSTSKDVHFVEFTRKWPTKRETKGIMLGMWGVIKAIDVHIQADNAIQESMQDLYNEIDLGKLMSSEKE